MSDQPSDAQLLLAEVQALRRSVSNLEKIAGTQADLQAQASRVVVTNVSIGFWAMVSLLVTAAIAAIPALLILGVVGAICWVVFLVIL